MLGWETLKNGHLLILDQCLFNGANHSWEWLWNGKDQTGWLSWRWFWNYQLNRFKELEKWVLNQLEHTGAVNTMSGLEELLDGMLFNGENTGLCGNQLYSELEFTWLGVYLFILLIHTELCKLLAKLAIRLERLESTINSDINT